jgi:hypothetical protein
LFVLPRKELQIFSLHAIRFANFASIHKQFFAKCGFQSRNKIEIRIDFFRKILGSGKNRNLGAKSHFYIEFVSRVPSDTRLFLECLLDFRAGVNHH